MNRGNLEKSYLQTMSDQDRYELRFLKDGFEHE